MGWNCRGVDEKGEGMTAQKTGKDGGSEEVWCLRAPHPHPPARQLSPGSCVQAGETLLARGGGEGERLGMGLAWGGHKWKLLNSGLHRPLSPRQRIFQKTPNSRGRPVRVSPALRICEGRARTACSLCNEASPQFLSGNAETEGLRAKAWVGEN